MIDKRFFITASLALAVCASFPAYSADAEFVWDMPNAFSTRALDGAGDKQFAELVAQKSDGRIKIVNHFEGALGYRAVDHLDAVKDGAVPIARHDLTPYGGYEPIFLVSTLPFQVQTPEDLQVMQRLATPYFEAAFLKHNQVMLSLGLFPPSGIWSREELNLDKMKNLKIRTPDKNSLGTLIEAGAAAVNMGFADVVPALSTGALDAVLTSADTGETSGLYDHLKVFTEINWAMPMTAITINKDTWDSLPDDLKTALREAGQEVTASTIERLGVRVSENYEAMRNRGVKIVTEPNAELIAAMKAGATSVIQEWRTAAGPSAIILDEYLKETGRQ